MEKIKAERLKRAGEVNLVPFDQIFINDSINNGRIEFGDIEELAISIREIGLKIPILVKKVRNEERYAVMQGKRRFKAISLLVSQEVDFPFVKCIAAPVTYSLENNLFDQIVMNDGKPYTNLEQGIVFAQLVDRGYSVTDISTKTGKSQTHITNCIEISSLPKKVRDLIVAGSVSGLTAVELSKVVDNEDELVVQLEKAVETAPVASDGKKKKVTKKNIKQLANVSTLKKLEEVKKIIAEAEGVDVNLVAFFNKLVSRLKAGGTVENLVELFK